MTLTTCQGTESVVGELAIPPVEALLAGGIGLCAQVAVTTLPSVR